MLYDEFLTGTGCKDNAHNYKVYKDLEVMYMNSEDITKEKVYEYGRKLVDNSLTESQLAWNAEIDEQIAKLQVNISTWKEDLERYKGNLEWSKLHGYDDIGFWKREIKFIKAQVKDSRNSIKSLLSCKYE